MPIDMLAVVRAQREEIARKMAALQAEDAELAIAERVIARLAPTETYSDRQEVRSGQPVRHIDLVVQTLATMPQRWARDWSHLQGSIRSLFNVEIPKSSLQPYLSNLKNDGIVVRDGPRIALKSRVAKGAGPQSDNSYDPATAAADDDEEKSPETVARRVMQEEEIRKAQELEAMRRRNIRNINN